VSKERLVLDGNRVKEVLPNDIVAELDRWLRDYPAEEWSPLDREDVQRARDEIVALRTKEGETLHRLFKDELANARAEALEQAAVFVADYFEDRWAGHQCAAAIRALKDKRDAND